MDTATNLALVPALNGQSTIFPTATVAGLTGLTCSFASPCQVQTVVNPNFHNPRAAEWNLDIQRAITSGMSVDVAYVGNHGFDEGYQVDLNQPAVGSGFTNIAGCIAVGTSDVPNTAPPGPAERPVRLASRPYKPPRSTTAFFRISTTSLRSSPTRSRTTTACKSRLISAPRTVCPSSPDILSLMLLTTPREACRHSTRPTDFRRHRR